ncbi:Wzz/FepE/Etk N-terminal domain-containing protein [Planktomarina temperata]|nr:Wzz/FepE/Etk N-terminal domain-containing protein [Planktomarina temperata]
MEETDGTEIDIRALLGVIRRQSRIILYTIASILIVTLAYLFTVTPKYTAVSLISIEPNRDVLSESVAALNNAGAISAAVEGEAEIIKSNDVLLALIRTQGLLGDDEFGVTLSNWDRLRNMIGLEVAEEASGTAELQSSITRLREAISVRRKGLTYLIEVGVTSSSPEKAANLSNALAREYITRQIQNKVERTIRARDILSRRVSVAKTELEGIEGEVDGFLTDFIDDFVLQTGREDLKALQIDLDAQTRELEAYRERLAALTSATSGKAWDRLSDDLVGDATRALLQKRRALNAKLRDTEDGIDAAVLRAELEALEEDLAEAATDDLRLTRVTVNEFQSSRDSLQQELRTSVLNADLPAGALTDLYQLQQEGGIARSQYQDLLRRLRQLDTLASLQIADATVASQALAPNRASFPRKKLVLALALVLSAGLGLGLGFLNEFFVGGFASEDQLRDVLKARDVISVPAISDEGEDVANAIIEAPLSAFSESFRQLKKAVDKLLRGKTSEGASVVLLTSAVPAEGKSTSGLSLARTYQQSGLRTVLVDLDLRKPSLGSKLGLEQNESLLNFLSGEAELESLATAAHTESASGLSMILGGGRPDVPTDSLMGSKRMRELVAHLRTQFDVIVLDTAPVLPVVDTLYLLDEADAVLQMVRFASTNQRDVRRAFGRITQETREGVETIPVLTMEQQRRGAYYYRGYYSGYGYTKRNY